MTVAVQELTKQYLLKTALNKVTVSFAEGKIHALAGENGAGKSTLASLIAGDMLPSSGKIMLDGREISFSSAKDALSHGIVLVHQRPLLASGLTVKENISLNESKSFFVRPPSKKLLDLQKKYAPGLPLNAAVRDLGGNMRFYTSLLGALLRTPKCLILDEPSAFLDLEERRQLYGRLRELTQEGMTVIVITHSTAEATQYADTVTVLTEGCLVSQFVGADAYKSYLASKENPEGKYPAAAENHMVPQDGRKKAVLCMSLHHVSARPKKRPALIDATINVPYGGITCVAGLQEAALGTLEDVVTGMESGSAKGSATFTTPDGLYTKKIQLGSGTLTAAFLRRHRAAIVPSDRNFRASDPDITVEQMLAVYADAFYSDAARKDGATENITAEIAKSLIREAGVNITPEQRVANLSGGMLQRLILARELSLDPDLIILCNPMQGLDVHSQGQLCKKITSLAEKGKAVLIIGTVDFPLSLCTNVYSLESGSTVLSFSRETDF